MILELNNIDKSFGEKEVLKGVSFTAEGGKAFGLLGRNGAGKTTSIRIIMNVFPANGGEVLLDGKPIDYNKIGLGYLPEERGLYPKKLVIDQLAYFAELKDMSAKEAIKAVDYWLDRLGMTEYRNKRLDPVNAMLLKDVVKEQILQGKIVLFSSHQMAYIEEFCDSIAILSAGRVAISGDLFEIKRNYVRDKLVVSTTNHERIKSDLGESCAEREDGTLLIQLASPAEKQSMMKRLVENYDIDEVKVFEPSLNDIFVEYAGAQV